MTNESSDLSLERQRAIQSEVVSFLARAGTLGAAPATIFETHGAIVLVGAVKALKIKRAVRYAYMDFSTLALRKASCEREITVNRPNAPGIYLGTRAITRESDGRLALDGKGPAVEWAVCMRAFEQGDLLSSRVAAGSIDATLLKATADAVWRMHERAPVATGIDSAARMALVVDEIAAGLASVPGALPQQQCRRFRELAESALAKIRNLLGARARLGRVRRCHGDLHLANIVVWKGEPVAFDAIEFDESLATIDTLYDLAFLIMDLDQRCQRAAANLVLNRYLWRCEAAYMEGLAALPLMLGLRAAIRAMVGLQKASLAGPATFEADRRLQLRASAAYLEAAIGYLSPPPPRLVAIGGLSGSGKSTLAAGLAPLLGAAPGALQLRSDLERKAILNVEETHRLPPSAYVPEMTRKVYERVMERALAGLRAGHSVIVDAVMADATERAALERLAAKAGLPLEGIWLDAAPDVLRARVGARSGDASDATPAVVERQLGYALGDIRWSRVDAGAPPATVLAAASAKLGLH